MECVIRNCTWPVITGVIDAFLIMILLCYRYAEIKYTQGGLEHMEIAKTYYFHTIRLNPGNMRALYGLLWVRVYYDYFRIF